jgi:integrase
MVPSISVSLYEQHLSLTKGSHNSVKYDLDMLAHLFTWALRENIDIEEMLLKGLAPTPVQVRKFTHWLSKRRSADSERSFGIGTFNRILDVSAAIFAWFIQQYGEFEGLGNRHTLDREQVVAAVEKLFRSHKLTERKKRYAGDLSEEEIETIEQYLKPANRQHVDKAVAVRDYLIWRLAIEFGFREGEILALRLCDCPHGRQHFIKIVRVEERGKDYLDPRGAYAPRPKTLSRDLGFVLEDTRIPGLIDDYVNAHRCKLVRRNSKVTRQPILDHDFLIINHLRHSGKPLSVSTMQKVAQTIARETGVNFHWHLARHAFFNRTYAAIAEHSELKDRMQDLVYWGGWADENSLQLYVNRARRERATTTLAFWQTGMNRWSALQ